MFVMFTSLDPARSSKRRCAAHNGRLLRGRARARFWLEGLEDRCLLSISEFPVPTPSATTWSITSGSDGNLWFTERDGNKVGMINPTTHAISEFTVPTASSSPIGITSGPDGNLWLTENASGKLGEINPTTHAITEFLIPSTGAAPWAISSGADGNLWFTDVFHNSIGAFSPTTHSITEFGIPSANAYPYGIAAGPDGNLWFTEYYQGQIGMINPTTHAITEFSIPNAGSAPDAITAGPDGNLWFTDDGNNTGNSFIGMINPTTHAIAESSVTPYAIDAWDGITSGPDGNLWFTDINGALGMINPTTHVITEYIVNGAASAPLGITAGPDGNVWFADQVNGIGVDYMKNLVVAQPPPASVSAGTGFGLTIQAEDSSGNLITSFNGTVTVSLANNPGGATLGGTLSENASNGVATFSGLTLTKAAAGYTLQASASGVGSATTSAITVTPAAASQLVITAQPPASVKLNSPFGLKASIEDAYGNVVTTANNMVKVSFANNPTGATLGGMLTVTASQGVATFSGLSINKVGSGYTLRVTSSGLSSAVTSAINVSKNGMSARTLFAPAGSPASDFSLAPLVLDSLDLWDGLLTPTKRRSAR
jgi:streptogramin lyase